MLDPHPDGDQAKARAAHDAKMRGLSKSIMEGGDLEKVLVLGFSLRFE